MREVKLQSTRDGLQQWRFAGRVTAADLGVLAAHSRSTGAPCGTVVRGPATERIRFSKVEGN